MTDQEIQNSFQYWLEHFARNGYRHYADTPEDRLPEIYWDDIIERMLEDIEGEESEIITRIETLCG